MGKKTCSIAAIKSFFENMESVLLKKVRNAADSTRYDLHFEAGFTPDANGLRAICDLICEIEDSRHE